MAELTSGQLARKKNRTYYIHTAITLVLMFAGFVLPTIGPLTAEGMKTVFIFIGVVYGMCTVGIIWPALLGMVLLGFTGYMNVYNADGVLTSNTTVAKVFLNGFGNDTYLFVFFLMIFAAVMVDCGLAKTIAYKMVSAKMAHGRPWLLSLLILLAAYLLGMLISCTPGILIPWAIVYVICDLVGYTNKDRWPKVMVIGIVWASVLGNSALPFKPLSLQMMASLNNATGITVDYVQFTIFAVLLSLLLVLGYWALAKWCYKVDVEPLKGQNIDLSEGIVYTMDQKILTVALALMFIVLFIPSFLEAGTPLKTFLTTLGSTAVVVLILVTLALMHHKDGTPIANIAKSIKNGVPWETLILLAFVMVISTALVHTGNGVKEGLTALLDPILGSASGFGFMVVLIIVASIGTQVLGNLIYGLLLMPIVCVYGAATGADLALLTTAMCVVLNAALFLPSANPLAGMLHGNSQWVSSQDIYKFSWPAILMTIIVSIIFTGVVGPLIF